MASKNPNPDGPKGKKTVVTLNRMPYGEFCDHVRHAEKREQEKKKTQAS